MGKQVVVIAGPSGSGKTSIAEGIVAQCKNCTQLVTATTRAPREGEKDGVDYHFFTKERFLEELERGNIGEYWHAPKTDRYYGTYIPDIEQKLAAGKIVVAVLQKEGLRFLKQRFDALSFFIIPDSFEDLKRRIDARGDMEENALQERLEEARREVAEDASLCDKQIKNEYGKLDEAIERVLEIMRREGYDIEDSAVLKINTLKH